MTRLRSPVHRLTTAEVHDAGRRRTAYQAVAEAQREKRRKP